MPLDVPSNNEIEADALMERAEKRSTAFSFLGFGGTSQSKNEEASEYCAKAGNLYKIEKKWKQAGDAYVKAADYLMRTEERDEVANKLVEASKCYKKSDPKEAVRVLQQAVEMLKERGRFHPAAGYQKQIAEIFESDLVDLEQAMRNYELAAELYAGEESGGLANQCWLKVATFAAQLEQYDKASEKFEQVATASLDNNLTKFSVKAYLLQAGLCHLCQDVVTAGKAVDRYQDLDMTFSQTRECLFLKDLIQQVEAGDVAQFTRVVAEFDRMTKLDQWKTTMLLRVKTQLSEEPSLT